VRGVVHGWWGGHFPGGLQMLGVQLLAPVRRLWVPGLRLSGLEQPCALSSAASYMNAWEFSLVMGRHGSTLAGDTQPFVVMVSRRRGSLGQVGLECVSARRYTLVRGQSPALSVW